MASPDVTCFASYLFLVGCQFVFIGHHSDLASCRLILADISIYLIAPKLLVMLNPSFTKILTPVVTAIDIWSRYCTQHSSLLPSELFSEIFGLVCAEVHTFISTKGMSELDHLEEVKLIKSSIVEPVEG